MGSNCGYVFFGFGYDWEITYDLFLVLDMFFFMALDMFFFMDLDMFFLRFYYGFGNGFGQNRKNIVNFSSFWLKNESRDLGGIYVFF
jgi:hypothetical protein